jgi:hypothetical protein
MAQTAAGNRLTPDERERMHGSRKRFTNEKDAIRSVVAARQQGRRTGSGAVYHCLVCDGFHVGQGLPVAVPALAANG